MRIPKAFLAAFLMLAALQVRAQSQESAPQEPPYTQENEFENATPQAPSDDVNSIENEIRSAEAPKEKSPVNLNEELNKTENMTVPTEHEAEPVVHEEPAVIPVAPPVEVKPLQEAKPSNVVRQSPKGGVEYIQHPQSAKGLLRIDKDGTYIYRTKEDLSYTTSGTFRIGMMDAPKIVSKDGTTDFTTMYEGSPVPLLMFDYQWQPFSSMPNFGLQLGFGALVSQGSGRFACDPAQCGTLNGTKAKEKYTFVAIPINAGLTYRLAWSDRQWMAPYVTAGGSYIPIAELRDDDSSPKAVGTPGVFGAGGLMFNVSAIDHDTGFTLKNEYDISNLWVTLEYRYLKTFNEDLDFSSSIISLGVSVDY